MIQVNEPLLDGNEKKYLIECIDTGWISSDGPFIKKFEEGMAKVCNRKHAIAVANGSVALDLAIVALGIGIDDEVILPNFTIISCAAAIARAGAKPILVDCDSKTWNIDVAKIEEKITPKTKAIMVVHIYGLPSDLDPIIHLAKKYNLKIIEDAAEMHGQTYNGKPCGSFGDISTFSFYPNKHITTGEGGMVLVNNDGLAETCRRLRNLCFIPPRRFVHEELGWNFRMSNMQAALGCAQLERLNMFVGQKREMGRRYYEAFKDIRCFDLQARETNYAQNIYWVFGIVLNEKAPFDAEKATQMLSENGIGNRPFFWPMSQQPVFNRKGWYNGETYPVSENIARRGFYVPSGLALTNDQISIVCDKVVSLFKQY